LPKPMKGNGRYMPGLDGLRALAVLAVIAYHLNLSWVPGGLLGVGVFFVLSGYLITDILVAQWRKNGHLNLKNFWIRRARRLLPGMLLMLLAVSVWIVLFQPAQIASLRSDVIAALLYVSNWWFIFHKVSYFSSFGPASPLGHLWSLAVEEQFYLIWPLLLVIGLKYIPRRGKLLGLTLALASASAIAMALIYRAGMDPSRVYYGTDTRAFSLLIGAALAFVWPSQTLTTSVSSRTRITLNVVGGIALFVILLMMWKTNEFEVFLYRGGLVLLSVVTAMLVATLAHPASYLGKMLGCKPLRWIGVRSYGIYLWHFPIIVLTTPTVDTGGVNVLRDVLQVAASIVIAELSWRLFEEPILNGTAGKKWADYWGKMRTNHHISRKNWITPMSLILFIGVFSLRMIQSVPLVNASSDSLVTSTISSHPNAPDTKKSLQKSAKTYSKTGEGVTAIGDSVMVDATPALKKLLPGIVCAGQIGRQMYQAPAVIADLKAKGELGNRIIIELGTNGPFTQQQLKSLLQSLGPMKQIILVNTRVPRAWQNVVNSTLAQVATAFPHTTLVNWFGASVGENNYFYPDGVHLNPVGAQAYAKIIAKALK